MKVDPTGDDIRRFRDEDDGGPVVMLNLLRFAGDAGRASYGEYASKVQPFLDGVGGDGASTRASARRRSSRPTSTAGTRCSSCATRAARRSWRWS